MISKTKSIYIFCLLASLAVLTYADTDDHLTGVYSASLSPTDTSSSNRVSSIEGGAYLYIRGYGFSSRSPLSNVAWLNNDAAGFSQVYCPINEYMTTTTLIVCTLPPAPQVGIPFTVKIISDNTGDAQLIQSCSTCTITYTAAATPQLTYMIPNAANPGAQIYFYGIQRTTSSLNVDYLKIGDERCDATDQNEFNPVTFSTNSYGQAPCNVTNDEAGYYSVSQRNLGATGYAQVMNTIPTFRFDGDAYDFVVVPSITFLSNNIGSSQGQVITIEGTGFSSSGQNQVNLADTECVIISQSSSQITCEVQPRTDAISEQGYHAGLNMDFYDNTNINSVHAGTAGSPGWSASYLTTEVTALQSTAYVAKLSGYFKAPVTGDYRFFVSVDDTAQLYISQTPGDRTNLQKILEVDVVTPYRFFFKNAATSQFSSSVSLEADGFYYMEFYYQQYTGSSYGTLGVQIPNTTNNVSITPEAQSVSVNCTADPEILKFSLSNVAGGQWNIVFNYLASDGKTISSTLTTANMPFNTTGANVASKISSTTGYTTQVEVQMLASDGSETENATLATTYNYLVSFISLRKNGVLPVIGASGLTGTGVSAKVTTVQSASPTVAGTFSISLGTQTVSIAYNAAASTFISALETLGFSDPILVDVTGDSQLGATWTIQFNGDGANPIDPLYISSNLLTGCKASPNVVVTTLQDSSNDLFYEVIPVELLFTAEDNPQITVQSNGITANCPNNNCNYVLQTDVPDVTALSYNAPTLTVTISNVATNDYSVDDFTVSFGNSECQVVSYVDSPLPATLTATCQTPEAGDFYPKVHFDGLGYPTIDSGVSALTVPVTIADVTPTVVNPNGGTVLTITGTGFPASLALAQTRGLEMQIGSSACTLTTVTPTQVQCTTSPVTDAAPLTVTLNTQTASSSSLSLLSGAPTISSISPTTVNPVLQSVITITGTNFDSDTTQTSVFLAAANGTQITECLTVSSTPTQITCQLLGAPTGTYQLYAQTSLGYSSSQTLNVMVIVTSISPSSGSNAGGTILTIQGGTFSTVSTQTLVFVGEANVACDVISSTETEIQCITQAKDDSYDETPQGVYVETRIVEEAVCQGTCTFAYLDSLTPQISSFNSSTVTPGDTIQAQGSNLASVPAGSAPVVTLNGENCPVVSNDDTTIVFTVPSDFVPVLSAAIIVSVAGKGYADISSGYTTLNVTPAIYSVSPSTGSSAGVLLTISGSGFQDGISVKVGTSGVCSIRSLTTTTIVCKTTSSGAISISYNDQTGIQCTGTCSVSLSTSLRPSVTSVAPLTPSVASSFSLTFTGSGFGTSTPTVNLVSQADATIIFQGTVTSNSASQVVATFTNIAGGNYSVEVINGVNIASSTATVTVPLTASVASSVQSSIAGGVTLSISGSGFYDNDQNDKNVVTVCGLPCEVTQSTPSSIECQVPAFINPTVEAAYPNIVSAGIISGATWSDIGGEANAFDNVFGTIYKSTTTNCYIGLDVGSGLLGEISEIRFAPDTSIISPSIFNGTVIEGSNDNIIYTTISTLTVNNYAGWNYIDLSTKATPVRFRYYRFRGGSSTAKCAFAEIQFRGIVFSDNTATDLSSVACTAVVTVKNQPQEIATTAVTYQQSLTPNLTSISPTMGTTIGGTVLTLTGSGFSTTLSNIQVTIDGVDCSVTAATSTQITCTTGPAPPISTRRSSLESELTIFFADKGYAVTNEITYFYIDRWSDINTWGGVPLPREGESVSIPTGQTILLDISPPKLVAIIVEGALIFEDKDLELECDYIMINEGRMQIGTWENPIQNHITITIHGTKESNDLPIFGNKVIASMDSILDIHGTPRSHTWTVLDSTADVSATSIVVQGVVDWVAGEVIIIASTDHDHYQSEERTILTATTDATSGTTTLTFTDPLLYRHYAGIQTIGDQTFEMRAEVGLLTRNIVIQGDSTSETNLYGVHIMTHSEQGDDNGVSRISYTEVRHAGQAYQMGRYPIHFHLMGNVRESYVIGNAVHNTYNRAITIHGVHYLLVQNNVAYWTMGHTIFIEDGIETQNTIENNLVINTIASNSLLNTDQTPSSYWVTNPFNIFRGNHAAGSDRYGFWFNPPVNPTGPSATSTICPRGMPLGEFDNNTAHSSGRYGLRIFDEFTPRTYPCLPLQPYEDNPPVEAVFSNYFGWKNKRDAVIGETMGSLTFTNIKAADNLRAGIEISNSDFSTPGTLVVQNTWIVGVTPENGYPSSLYSEKEVRGLITPRSDNLYTKNVHFYNFGENMTAIESCSHCEFAASTDTDARTQWFQGLTFYNVSQRVRFNQPWKSIFVDTDGSLTDNTAGGAGVVTYFYDHLNVPGCVRNETVFNGLVCDETVTIRRVEFVSLTPTDSFKFQPLQIYNLDYNPDGVYGIIPYTTVNMGWGVPFVTNYSYKVNWQDRADWSAITINPSEVIPVGDKTITLVFNHSEYRETFDVFRSNAPTVNVTNTTTLWTESNTDTEANGEWYHDVTNQLLYLAINGENKTNLVVDSVKCRVNCPTPFQDVPKEDFVRLWSNASMWTNGVLPQDGEDVLIPANWTILLDVNTSNLGTLDIQGDFYFDNSKDNLVLMAQRILVEGQLFIGNNTDDRFTRNAKILLTGDRNSDDLVIGELQDVSNKVLAVTGNVTMYGTLVNNIYVRLQAPANIGDTTITLPSDIDWSVGDDIALAPSQLNFFEFETRTIIAINNGVVTLDQPLQYYHFGAATTTKETPYGTLDTRTEVALLTRNIVIEGSNEDYWGGRVYVGEVYYQEYDYLMRGRVDLDGVVMQNMGQPNTTLAGFTIDTLTSSNNDISTIRRCVIRDSLSYQLQVIATTGVTVEQSVFYNGFKFLVDFEGVSSDIQFNNNLLIGSKPRGFADSPTNEEVDNLANIFAKETFIRSTVSGNVLGGCGLHCFLGSADLCSGESFVFSNNVVHSGNFGWVFVEPSSGTCGAISGVTAYKLQMAIVSMRPFQTIKSSNLIVADNLIGISTNNGGITADTVISLTDSYIAGLSRVADPSSYWNTSECSNTAAIYVPAGQVSAKSIPPKKPHMPWQGVDEDAIWRTDYTVSGIIFENFQDTQVPGCTRNTMFQSNPASSDTSANTMVTNITKINADLNNIIWYNVAQDGWVSLDNCGTWYCTGIKNMVIRDLDGTLSGQVTSIIPLNPGVLDTAKCTVSTLQGAYFCHEIGWSTLVFESLDADAQTRIISPINVTIPDVFRNDLNTYRDNQWDGFYTSLKRLSRFVSVVMAGFDYTVLFTGTLPNNMRWQIHGGLATENITAEFRYTQAQSVAVKDINGAVVKQKVIETDADSTIALDDPCGTNIYSIDTQSVRIKLTGDANCLLYTVLMNSVTVSVRYDIPLSQFFAEDGASAFVDRIAAILGINPASIRVVQVKSGSSIAIGFIDSQYQGDSTDDTVNAYNELQSMITTLNQAAQNGQLDILNSTILNYSFGYVLVHPDQLSTNTETVTSGNNAVFIIIAVVVAVIALAVGGFFAYKRYKRRGKVFSENAVVKVYPQKITVSSSVLNTEHHLVAESKSNFDLSSPSPTKKPFMTADISQNSPTLPGQGLLSKEASTYGLLGSPARFDLRSPSAANVDDIPLETGKPLTGAGNM